MSLPHHHLSRRRFLASTVLASGARVTPRLARRAVARAADRARPGVPSGVQAGEAGAPHAVIQAPVRTSAGA